MTSSAPRYALVAALASAGLASVARAGDSPDTLSQADIKALLDTRAKDADSPGVVKMYLECCGIDLKNKTVRVIDKMMALRDSALKDIAETNPDDANAGAFGQFERKCKTRAKVVIDIAEVIDMQGNGPSTGQVFDALADACNNPPNATYTKLIQKFKVIHFRLMRDSLKRPASDGFRYELNAKTGELTVWAFRDASDVGNGVLKWIAKQAT